MLKKQVAELQTVDRLDFSPESRPSADPIGVESICFTWGQHQIPNYNRESDGYQKWNVSVKKVRTYVDNLYPYRYFLFEDDATFIKR